jgi:4-hydroxybenzoyl-CoA reductase subunit beta
MTYAMPPFQLHQPATVDEALALAGAHPGALYLAGGTDLMVNLRKRLHEPEHVIALGNVAGLRGVTEAKGTKGGPGTLAIGALTRIAELAADPLVRQHLPMLAEAAGLVAGPTIRGMGTLGGNLCLDTRCRYYNQSYFWRQANDFCLKKEGTVCHVAPGGSFCWAAYSGDTAPALLVLEAEVELAGPGGTRRLPLAGFYGTDGRWAVGTEPGGRQPGELLLRVHVPIPEPGWQGVYEKLRVRDSIDYPLVGVALAARRNGKGALDGLRMALTAVNPRPEPLPGLDAYLGRPLDLEVLDGLQRKANKAGKPMRTTVADPAYRRSMIASLVAKAVLRLAPELKAPYLERMQQGA